MASKTNGTLYIGMTNNLSRRISEHKSKIKKCFTERYNVIRLVYYETQESFDQARQRERNLKKWSREWKINLINSFNPSWDDLNSEI